MNVLRIISLTTNKYWWLTCKENVDSFIQEQYTNRTIWWLRSFSNEIGIATHNYNGNVEQSIFSLNDSIKMPLKCLGFVTKNRIILNGKMIDYWLVERLQRIDARKAMCLFSCSRVMISFQTARCSVAHFLLCFVFDSFGVDFHTLGEKLMNAQNSGEWKSSWVIFSMG